MQLKLRQNISNAGCGEVVDKMSLPPFFFLFTFSLPLLYLP
jgi:hypothetical protein